jgi:PDZ domain-containing protein
VSRRGLTLLLAGLLALGLTLAAAVSSVPYVGLGPGPTYNTLGKVDGDPVLEVEGRRSFPTDGHLDLTTVNVQTPMTLVQALEGWFDRDIAVVPRDLVFDPEQTDEQIDEENTEAMRASQSVAVRAAARHLGLKVSDVSVADFAPSSPARRLLEVDDVLTTVDGRRVRDGSELRDLISSREPGEPVRIGYTRDGRGATAVIQTTEASGRDGEAVTVIGVVTQEEPVEVPFEVKISLDEVGGPSAGLMFTLGILDKLDAESLTGGKYIAGTGEISPDGTVGQIGGINHKLVAAQRKGADAFLVPEENCAQAVQTAPEGLLLVQVGTLTEALDGLAAVRDGKDVRTCAA